MTAITLVPAEPADEPFLRELQTATMRPLVERIWGWDAAVQEGFFRQYFEAGGISIVKAACVPVGSAQVHQAHGHIYLSQVEISPRHQGHGYGTQVIRHVQGQAKDRGVPLNLQVLKINEAAFRLYQRLGFVITGETDTHCQMTWPAIEVER